MEMALGDSAFGGDEVMRVCNWMSGVLMEDSKELAVLPHHVRTQWIVSMNEERVLMPGPDSISISQAV